MDKSSIVFELHFYTFTRFFIVKALLSRPGLVSKIARQGNCHAIFYVELEASVTRARI